MFQNPKLLSIHGTVKGPCTYQSLKNLWLIIAISIVIKNVVSILDLLPADAIYANGFTYYAVHSVVVLQKSSNAILSCISYFSA